MDTILPTKYSFNNKNVLTQDKMHVGTWDKMPQWLCNVLYAGGAFVLCILTYMLVNFQLWPNHYNAIESFFVVMIALVFSIGVLLCGFENGAFNKLPLHRPYEKDCQFKLLPKSNLVVMQSKADHPKRENETKSYSYQLYVKDLEDDNNLTYLGQIKNNQIKLNDNTKAGDLFTSYYYYIQKHRLTDQFKKILYFVKDPKTTNVNGVPQYILKGDGITLKIRSNENTTYQIYAVKD